MGIVLFMYIACIKIYESFIMTSIWLGLLFLLSFYSSLRLMIPTGAELWYDEGFYLVICSFYVLLILYFDDHRIKRE